MQCLSVLHKTLVIWSRLNWNVHLPFLVYRKSVLIISKYMNYRQGNQGSKAYIVMIWLHMARSASGVACLEALFQFRRQTIWLRLLVVLQYLRKPRKQKQTNYHETRDVCLLITVSRRPKYYVRKIIDILDVTNCKQFETVRDIGSTQCQHPNISMSWFSSGITRFHKYHGFVYTQSSSIPKLLKMSVLPMFGKSWLRNNSILSFDILIHVCIVYEKGIL